MTRALLLALILCLPFAARADEPKANQLFGAKTAPSQQQPEAIGSYAKGCLAGAVQLPETGPTWQAMRLSRNRNWGHPDMMSFIERISQAAVRHGWAGLYIGDISQPRGGPMVSGHQSHQMGLDVDIWMLPAMRLNLTRTERENLSSISVRNADQTWVNANFTKTHMMILKAAAEDKAVDRIFVTPPVKAAMCDAFNKKGRWLQKIRPLYGHHYHFHVRLKCPRGDRDCETQRPTVRQLSKNDTGCDRDLDWWLTDYLEALKNPPKVTEPKPKKRGARDYVMADLPDQCAAVLASD